MNWTEAAALASRGTSRMSTPMPRVRVFVADDHRITLWGLQHLIGAASQMEVAGCAQSCGELLEHPALPDADVLLLELDLASTEAVEVVAAVRRRFAGAVLVLTASDDVEQHRRVVELGARGVVHKSEPPETILRAIEKVHAGDAWPPRERLGDVPDNAAPSAGTTPLDEHQQRIASLTPREREIVATMVRHASSKQMAVAMELGVSEHTLRNHLTAIYQKLRVRGRLDLHLYALQHGLGTPTTASGRS